MGLRELATADSAVNQTGCRLLRWLDTFEGDDRAFLVERLESARATDLVYLDFRRWDLPELGKSRINEHRLGRCVCGPDAPGRKA